MQNVAQSWLVYRLTGSSALLGAVGFSGQIPVLLLSPVGGIVADRFNRRNIVVGTQTASMLLAFTLAALALSGSIRIWHIFVLSALLGAVNSFDIPARQSFFVEIVGRDDLINAIALNSSIFNASRVVGPAVAGILVATIGEAWCFFSNAVSYIAVIAGLLMMKTARREPARRTSSPVADIIEGFGFVIHNPPVHALLILLGVVSLTGMGYTVLMPVFADRILHGGAPAMGWLMGCAGLGALSGALLLASRKDVKGLGRWVALASSGFSLGLVAFSASRILWLSALVLVFVGFCLMLEMGSSNTLIQSMVPDRLRGRVMSVYSMMFMGMAPIGSLLAGAVAEKSSARIAVGAAGVICLIASALFWSVLPRMRLGARRLIVAQQMEAANPPQEMTGGSVKVQTD